jgi:hypothetical protein
MGAVTRVRPIAVFCVEGGRRAARGFAEVSLVSIRRWVPIIVGAVLVTLLSPLTANAQATAAGVDCGLPESDADALVILNNFYPGYGGTTPT